MPEGFKASLIITLSQLPLLGGGWLWWTDRLQMRPVYAALVGVGYEATLLLATFAKKVWKDELEKDAIKVTADWVRGFVRGFAPGFGRRYKKQVVQDHGIFNVRGLGLINTYTLRLEQVFVDLRIDPSSNPQRFNVDPIARKELAGNRPVWDFLREGASVQEATALAVIGPPGCGKTTLLQHIAVTLAANRQHRHKVRAYTPVLLFLRDHVRKILGEQPPSLGRLAQEYFGDPQLFPTLRTPPGWFERRLEGGKCVVLLDGLDEVADADERRAVSAWVDKQIASYPSSRFLLTARPQGYADAPLQRAHILEVQPFNARQVRRFVENWYLANEIVASGGREDENVRQRASKDSEDLLRRLRATPSLDALTVNPLLLTMIAMVHRYHGALPGSRVELYDEICEVLLGRWRQSRGVHDPLKTGQKLVVLRPLAAHMMGHRIRDITTEEAASVIAEPLKLVGVTEDEAPEIFLASLQAGSGLLLEREAGQWSFAHLTFQEYLTAAHWLEQKEWRSDWHALVGDSWWHETLRLYAAQGDATPLVRDCLEVDTVPALALAADFLEEARQLLPEVRRAAEQRLIKDLEADDPARRHLAAEVRLARRLRNLQRMDDEREIDLDFITCAEYQLFLDDMYARGQYRQPDHWREVQFAKGDALKPITGVRAEDAVAFCDWLTGRQGGSVFYRTPRVPEAQQFPSTISNVATWCVKLEEYQLLGLTEAEEQRLMRELLNYSDSTMPPPISKIHEVNCDFCIKTYKETWIGKMEGAIDKEAVANQLVEALEEARTFEGVYVGSIQLRNARILAGRLLNADKKVGSYAFNRDLLSDSERAPAANSAGRFFDLALPLASSMSKDFNPVVSAITDNDFRTAERLLEGLENDANVNKQNMILILGDLIAFTKAEQGLIRRSEQRRYLAQLFEQLYSDPSSAEGERRSWRFYLAPWGEQHTVNTRETYSKAFWWLQIVTVREEGKLPAWEGIRIVREDALSANALSDARIKEFMDSVLAAIE